MTANQQEHLLRRPWKDRINASSISFALFIVLVVSSLPVLEGSGRQVNPGQQFVRFVREFFPPDLSVLPSVLAALWETIQIAAVATLVGVFVSMFIGLAGARQLSPRWLVTLVRFFLNGIRTLPSLIWALLAVVILGANSLAGVAALSMYSVGYLGKFFSESFESLDMEVPNGLRQLGASRLQAFQYGLWPSVRPLIWSHTLWMLEYNIRSASIIGYVGAGGIGLQLLQYQEFAQWDRFATVLLCILLIVIALDAISAWVRRQLAQLTNSPSA